jgi:fumarylacetoacetate (FAA) hydrolase
VLVRAEEAFPRGMSWRARFESGETMKLGSLKEGGRDGTLIVVSRDLSKAVKASGIAATLQRALEEWQATAPRLNALYEVLNASTAETINGEPVFALDFTTLAAPLPRAYEFVDGSAYLPHVERVRRARGAEVPESFYVDPLMYQAVSAGFYGPRDPVQVRERGLWHRPRGRSGGGHRRRAAWRDAGTGRVAHPAGGPGQRRQPAQPDSERAGQGFRLPAVQAAFGAVAGVRDARRAGRCLAGQQGAPALLTHINGRWFGAPEAGIDMQFSFAQLVAHAAKTRPLSAGTIVGSGTVANEDTSLGASCFAEQRTVETLRDGKPSTPFMSFGDTVRIEMLDREGRSVFGAIEQRIERYPG